jgi:ABC-2 type transport system ATP-binding protein
LTTHELPEAEKMADRIVIMAAGRVVLEGTPAGLTGAASPSGLSFGGPPGLDTASLAAAIGPGAGVTETTPGRYRVEGAAGPSATAAVATWLAERQAQMTDLTTGRTLEEVYLDAVGTEGTSPEGAEVGADHRRRGRQKRRAR